MTQQATWTIEGDAQYWDEFPRLPDGHQERVRRLLVHLQVNPHAPYPGVKELRGTWKGTYEFTISQSNGSRRLFFTIDDETRTVHLERIAPHPNWNRSRDAGGIGQA